MKLRNLPFSTIADLVLLFAGCIFIARGTNAFVGMGVWLVAISARTSR